MEVFSLNTSMKCLIKSLSEVLKGIWGSIVATKQPFDTSDLIIVIEHLPYLCLKKHVTLIIIGKSVKMQQTLLLCSIF